jgi:phosphohistidine phosphatase
MPTLILLRHAKAANPIDGQKDFDRPLTDRGHADATRVGKTLAELNVDMAIVSSARRTRETWSDVQTQIDGQVSVMLERALYLCSPAHMIARIQKISVLVQNVIIIGHNPCMHEVALWLAGKSNHPAAREMRIKFPTAAAAIFSFETSEWNTLAPAGATLTRFVTPADLN